MVNVAIQQALPTSVLAAKPMCMASVVEPWESRDMDSQGCALVVTRHHVLQGDPLLLLQLLSLLLQGRLLLQRRRFLLLLLLLGDKLVPLLLPGDKLGKKLLLLQRKRKLGGL